MLRAMPNIFKLGGFRSLWQHTARYFSDPRVRQAFSLQPLLVGGNPLNTTAIYGLIHAMERKGGIWFAKGGTSALVSELVALAKRHGVRFRYGARVEGVSSDAKGRLTSFTISEEGTLRDIACDVGVWGGDPQMLYRAIGKRRLSRLERIRLSTVASSMGLYVLYFKTKRSYPEVAHHTIVLSKRWEGLLREIFSGSRLPPDPSLYLHRPAATDPSLRDESGELFYVLAPVPHLGNFNNWEGEESRFKETVISILEERALPGLSTQLEFSSSIDPRYFKNTLMSPLGAGFSIAPLLRQSAWFRFHNRMDKIENLYLCGAGVHPGGGLPGVVTSAKVIENMVRRHNVGNEGSSSSDHRGAFEAAA
jgi:phytoene desaturase